MEIDLMDHSSPDGRHDEARSPASLPVTAVTHLHPGEAIAERPAIIEEDEPAGRQAPVPGHSEPMTAPAGVTMAILAEALNLEISFLQEQGISDCKKSGQPAVRIPYLDHDGQPLAVKWLLNLWGDKAGFERRKGDKPALYGLRNLDSIRQAGGVFLVDGPFDFWVCWHHGIAALGLPGKGVWRDDWSQYLSGLEVFLFEKDAPALAPRLAPSVQDLQIIRMPEGFDNLTAAHLQGMDLIDLLQPSLSQTVPAGEFLQNRANGVLGQLEADAAAVLTAPDPVEMVRQEIRRLGYGGDLNFPLITYLSLTSRVLAMRAGAMPVHLLLLGQPSAGKSYILVVVLKLLPPESYNKIDAGSPKVFIYDDFDYQHRVAIFSEADSLPAGEDNPAASAIRNMLQDHSLHYKVTQTDPETGQFVVREIDKPGPTVLVTTAVKRLGAQLDSRLFSLEVPDGPEQIQAALKAQANIELHGVAEPDPALIAYQSYLQAQAPWEVLVPFADQLAEEVGRLPNASRILRDYARLTSLIKAVAVLRHRNRQRDETGCLIAEIEDYALVHELVGKMYETSVTSVSDKIRNVIRAVGELRSANITLLTETKVAERLGISKQAITRAVKTALKQGWLVNHETKRGYPFDLDVGEPLPEALGLPDPKSLREEPGEPQEDEVAEALELQVPGEAQDTGERQAVQSLTGERW
jgi:hypothetical protein